MSEDVSLGEPVDWELEGPATLRDGVPVWIRPIRPTDRNDLIDFVEHVAVDSLEMRYFAATRPETAVEAMLRRSPEEERVALVAVGGPEGGSRVLGQAEYVVDKADPSTAEAAFVVRDAFLGRGLGTILLHWLARIARARGVHRFVAYLQESNQPMLDVFRNSGFPVVESGQGYLLRVDFSIVEPPGYLPFVEAEHATAG
jgi:acetate---CoA ligase (ADP-forming)